MDGGASTTEATSASQPPQTQSSPPEMTSSIALLEDDTRHAQNGSAVDSRSESGQHEVTDNGREPRLVLHDVSRDQRPDDEPRMPRPRMTIDLETDDMDIFCDSKLSIEHHSPKPCIAPGNALHLIDDDPSPRSQTPASVIIIPTDGPAHDEDSNSDSQRSPSEPPPVRSAPRVRFRSRVRITSGVHRHRNSMSAVNDASTPSSASDSPSSSISAPLRYQADENTAWGPLGKRLSAYANAGGWHRRDPPSTRGATNGQPHGPTRPRMGAGSRHVNERTPLIHPGRRPSYENYDHDVQEDEDEDSQEREMRAKREQDEAFGTWPRRLLNPHWWWWHLEPIVCCLYCSEEYEYEE